MSTRPVTFALVGCGGIAEQLAAAVETVPDASLVACADLDAERAKTAAETHGIDAWFTDHEAMLREAAPDVAVVATPNGTHGDIVVDCAEAGVHVLCQKPMEITVAALDEMVDACERHGVKLGALYNLRVAAGSVATERAVRNGALGDVVLANGILPAHRGEAYYQGWHGSAALDGGTLFTQASHVIDRLAWFNGGIERVFADTDTVLHDIETEDVAAVAVRYGNGAKGTITATTASPTYPHYDRVDLHGTQGHLVSTHDSIQSFDSEVVEDLDDEHPYDDGGFVTLVRDMTEAVREDREPMIPGRTARHPLDAILAMHESARREEPVVVEGFLAESRAD